MMTKKVRRRASGVGRKFQKPAGYERSSLFVYGIFARRPTPDETPNPRTLYPLPLPFPYPAFFFAA
jgi:hypothetical protein